MIKTTFLSKPQQEPSPSPHHVPLPHDPPHYPTQSSEACGGLRGQGGHGLYTSILTSILSHSPSIPPVPPSLPHADRTILSATHIKKHLHPGSALVRVAVVVTKPARHPKTADRGGGSVLVCCYSDTHIYTRTHEGGLDTLKPFQHAHTPTTLNIHNLLPRSSLTL